MAHIYSTVGSKSLPLRAPVSEPSLRRTVRSAFTLVELLVVIAIIGILVSLLLPAVQQARESGRRISCISNLKQLGIAVQNYADAHGMLPPSGIVDPLVQQYSDINGSMFMYPVYDQRSGKMFSWAVLLLPFLEEGNLYDRFDFSQTVLNQSQEPQRQQVPVFNCPSDAGQARLYSDHDYTSDKWFAKGNYAAYDSPMHSDLQLLYPGALIATGQKLSRILDGLSNTICFSEVRTRDDLQDERGAWALPWNGASLLALDMHHDSVAAGSREGDFQALAIPEILEQVQVPNMMHNLGDILVRCPGDTASNQLEGMPCHQWVWYLGLSGYISAAPRSNHVGGVNAAFLDGHVRFISDGIDPVEFAYLIDPRDSQVTTDAER